MSSALRVAYVSLGCRTNRVETDAIAAELERKGLVLSGEDEADVVVVNTCAVTGEAEAKTRKAVRHAASLARVKAVVATGCVASLHAGSLTALSPRVVVETDKSRVADRVLAVLSPHGREARAALSGAPRKSRPNASQAGLTPTGRTRPGVKVQDGCDHRCAYCVVWKARGQARSVPADEVAAQVADEVALGAQEVVLTGINVGSYRDGRVGDLAGLLRALLATTDVARLRLASIEPEDVTPSLLDAMAAGGDRIAPFLHVCLQSGCDTTLRRMARPYDSALFARVVDAARSRIPDISLGTDVIVGFPGETDLDAEESLAFCRGQRFSRMHVFRYSSRPGTPAARMPDQVAPQLSAARAARMRALARELRESYAQSRIGREELVLVQASGRGVTGGLLDARVRPEEPVGGLVRAQAHARRGDLLLCDGGVRSKALSEA